MTNYLLLQVAIALGAYGYLVKQFQLAAKKHTGSITEVIQSGNRFESLIAKYWNIMLALLGTLFFIGRLGSATLHPHAPSLFIPITICLVAVLVSSFGKIPVCNSSYPITSGMLRYYIFIRSCYLISYELFFRGLLLELLMAHCSIEAAICINVFLYTLAHIHSPKAEIIACIPLGFLFCWLRLEFGSVLFPVLLHLCIALPFEIRILHSSTLKN